MAVPAYFQQKDNWPHQFTKDGKEYLIGDNGGLPLFAQPMICVHCYLKYTSRLQPKPQGRCPARSDKREMKRIDNVR